MKKQKSHQCFTRKLMTWKGKKENAKWTTIMSQFFSLRSVSTLPWNAHSFDSISRYQKEKQKQKNGSFPKVLNFVIDLTQLGFKIRETLFTPSVLLLNNTNWCKTTKQRVLSKYVLVIAGPHFDKHKTCTSFKISSKSLADWCPCERFQ